MGRKACDGCGDMAKSSEVVLISQINDSEANE